MTRHRYACGGPLSLDGSCGAGDCPRCHPEWAYEVDPGEDDDSEERADREADLALCDD